LDLPKKLVKALTTVLPVRLLKKNKKSGVRSQEEEGRKLPITHYPLPITTIDISYKLHNSLSSFYPD
jgi:hypothetical protein